MIKSEIMTIFSGIPDAKHRACIQLSARLLVRIVILLLYLNLHIRIFRTIEKEFVPSFLLRIFYSVLTRCNAL